MPDHYRHNLQALDDFIHDTGALYLSDTLDEMLYVLLVYINDNPDTKMDDPVEHFYHLRKLRDLFKELETAQ